MQKVSVIKIVLFIVGFAIGGVAVAGGRGLPGIPPPVIVKVALDATENVLVITGRNFGETPPTVTLADAALVVKRFSENEVVATLPRGLTPATYGITVTTHGIRHRAVSNQFSATLPGAGKK